MKPENQNQTAEKNSQQKQEEEIKQGEAMQAYLEREGEDPASGLEENKAEEKEIENKKASGRLLSQQEAARLREKELLENQSEQEKALEQEEQPEQSVEQEEDLSLDQAREIFAKCKINADKWLKAESKFGKKKTEEDFLKSNGEAAKEYRQAKEGYTSILKQKREELYQQAVEEIDDKAQEKEWSEIKKNKELKKKMEEIVKETIVYEADRIYEAKTSFILENKFLGEQRKKIAETSNKILEWYRKQPKKYKFLMAGGLLGAGLAGGAIGGAAGGILVSGACFARVPLRVLSGGVMAAGTERFLKSRQEKKSVRQSVEKVTEHRDYGDALTQKIKQNDASLDKRLLELEGESGKKKRRRYLGAATAGLFISSGAMGKLMGIGLDHLSDDLDATIKQEPIEEDLKHKGKIPEMEKGKASSGIFVEDSSKQAGDKWGKIGETQEKIEPISKEVDQETFEKEAVEQANQNFIETAKSGDSVWKMSQEQLVKHYGEEFNQLDPASQAHIIDSIKDRIAENSAKFGLENPDNLKVGQQIDFSEILDNKNEMDKIFNQTSVLTDNEKVNILSAKNKLGLWVQEHPEEKLTSEKVSEILRNQSEEIVQPGIDPDAFKNGESFLQKAVEETAESGELSEEELNIAGEEKQAAEIGEKAEIETKISSIEDNLVKRIGFNQSEYGAIKDIKVKELLEKLPSEERAWEMYRETPVTQIELPHDGVYGPDEFGKQVKLAEYLRSFNPDKTAKNLSIHEFIRKSIQQKITQ